MNAPDTTADVRAIELLGMFGRAEGVPGLARLLVPDLRPAPPSAPGRASPTATIKDDLAATIVIALGRLGGELARVTLEAFAAQGEPTVKLPLLWALGRVGGAVAAARARQEVVGTGTDGAIIGCLALGRTGGVDAEGLLVSVAGDVLRPVPVRVAALLGLGLGGRQGAKSLLRQLAGTADRALAGAAERRWPSWTRRGKGQGKGQGKGKPRTQRSCRMRRQPSWVTRSIPRRCCTRCSHRTGPWPLVRRKRDRRADEGESGRSPDTLTCCKVQRRMPCHAPVPGSQKRDSPWR